jgi:peptidylprolyl isomerase
MIRTFIAAAAATVLLTGCTNSQSADVQTPEERAAAVSETFEKYLPWDGDAKNVEKALGGLQYIVLKEGKAGGKSPTAADTVMVHYEGRLPTGEKFDGSYGGDPITFPLGQVIPGWTQGVQLMSEGDEYLFYIPSELAYGQNPRPGGIIKPGDDLVFKISLIEVVQPKVADAEAWNTFLPWPSDNPKVVKTGTGLEYVVLASGDTAGVSPVSSQMVAVHYEGRFAESGELFDSSFQRQKPAVFPADGVIAGWVEALQLMKPGDRWLVYVPSDLAYGAAGRPGIPPNAPLMFEVELLDVM